jgi:anhydro-N-acetylmuramic acid kinase
MSGTSLDGVDGALCAFSQDGRWLGVQRHASRPFKAELRSSLAGLQRCGPDEVHRCALAANALAGVYADVVNDLLGDARPSTVRAIGAHGQTIRHQPGRHDGTGYTTQINNPALLAELCGIDVVADFRSRDVAAGGQGAPLVPPFHQAVFGTARTGFANPPVVVNIGGISNLTVLRPGAEPIGFDCGPGNALLDHWAALHLGEPYDARGRWSAGGRVLDDLLDALRAEPYFASPPPKSTGRDLFNPDWLTRHLSDALRSSTSAQDVQATLCELTAAAIAADVLQHAPGANELLVCGGGVHNDDLIRRLACRLPHCQVLSTAARGLPPLQVEAAAFAWLARQHCHRQSASMASVTGARGARILGACYPA